MFEIINILSLIAISAAVACIFTYIFHDGLQRILRAIKHALLSPRYLKKQANYRTPKNRRS